MTLNVNVGQVVSKMQILNSLLFNFFFVIHPMEWIVGKLQLVICSAMDEEIEI